MIYIIRRFTVKCIIIKLKVNSSNFRFFVQAAAIIMDRYHKLKPLILFDNSFKLILFLLKGKINYAYKC